MIEKKLESVLNSTKVKFECVRHPEEQTAIVVKITLNGEVLLGVMTDEEGAKKLIEQFSS